MPRPNRVSRQILEIIKDGKPRSMRELQHEIGVNWNAVHYNILDSEKSLLKRGCVEKVKTHGELKHFAQDEYVYKPGPNYEKCLLEEGLLED